MSKKILVGILGLAIAILLCVAPSTQALEGDHDGDIVLAITVMDRSDPVEEAEVDVLNETGDLVDSGLTDENGTVIISTNKSLEDSEIKVNHDDLDDPIVEEIDISLPEDENETVYESVTVNIGTDYVEEGRDYYEENQALVLGGGLLFFMVVLVILNKKKITKGW